jgi:ABC-type bacteriocin/lantibiotic exporter with double-glycine peptidase domain
VLVFDEATSSVDPLSATELAETVNALRGKVAMLFVAHNLPERLIVDKTVARRPTSVLDEWSSKKYEAKAACMDW